MTTVLADTVLIAHALVVPFIVGGIGGDLVRRRPGCIRQNSAEC